MKTQSNCDFLSGPILPSLLRFASPVLLALVLQALYGAVDLWAVGKFATPADISAVSTGSQSMQIITGIVSGLSMGTTILLGQRIGLGDGDGAAKAIGTSIEISIALGIVLTIVMVAAAPAICKIMNVPDAAFTPTAHYIRICGSGGVCIVAYNLLSAIFRGMGDSKSPLFFVSVACVANIVGDIALTKWIPLGAAGAAIATVAAQTVSVVLSLVFISKRGLPFPLKREHLKFHAKTATNILRLGSPIALQDMCNEISYLVLIGLVNVMGVNVSAGVGIAEKLVVFIFLVPMSYMQSISAFAAQNIGAGNVRRARKAMWEGMATATVLGGIIAYFSFFHGDILSSLFIGDVRSADSVAVINASAEFLKASSIECFVLTLAYCMTGYFNGMGETTFVMAQGLCSIFLVKIPFAWLASHQNPPQLFRIGLSTAYAALFTLTTSLAFYACSAKRKSGLKPLAK